VVTLTESKPRALDANDVEAQDFLAAFDTFVQAVRRARGAPVQGGERALTLSQYGLLSGLSERRAAPVRELATEAGVTASTATRILDTLERRGIVRRRRTDEDRRVVIVTLTQLGRDLLSEQDNWLQGRQLAFHAGLPAQERRLAPDLLVRLAGLIEELASGPNGGADS
jgi:MarR family transcriptional regulator, organic hydroperoxide resistance regulator